ncbi:MAG: hypothetical protein ABJA62_05130 [Luteimonas sp.]
MDPISLEELGLLECLANIDRHVEPDFGSEAFRQRLLDSGLVELQDDKLVLTPAGIERCRALHHRVAADKEAEKVLAERAADDLSA